MCHAGFVCSPIGNASNIWVNINSSSEAEEVDLREMRVKTEEYACCALCKTARNRSNGNVKYWGSLRWHSEPPSNTRKQAVICLSAASCAAP